MDQATPEHQSLLRHQRERREDSNQDCSQRLCAGRHRSQTARPGTSLYQILQILSLTLFEKTPILQALQPSDSENDLLDSSNQLILCDFLPDSSDRHIG